MHFKFVTQGSGYDYSSKSYIFEFGIFLVLLESCGYVAKIIQTQMVKFPSKICRSDLREQLSKIADL